MQNSHEGFKVEPSAAWRGVGDEPGKTEISDSEPPASVVTVAVAALGRSSDPGVQQVDNGFRFRGRCHHDLAARRCHLTI